MQSKGTKTLLFIVLAVLGLGLAAFFLPEPALNQALVETPLDAKTLGQ